MIFSLLALAAFAKLSTTPPDLLDDGYRDMYNLQFDAAHRAFHEWERLHPEDPMGPVSDAAAYLFFEFDRLGILRSEFFVNDRTFVNSKVLTPDPKVRATFESDLAQTTRLANAALSNPGQEKNARFADVVGIALRADYEALIEKRYLQSLRDVKQARNQANDLLSKYPDCYDANLAIGVENYLLSLKSAPVRWFLRLGGAETDRATGIVNLQLVAEKGHYLRPYAKILLAIAFLRSGNTAETKRVVAELARQFPNNDLFRDELRKLD